MRFQGQTIALVPLGIIPKWTTWRTLAWSFIELFANAVFRCIITVIEFAFSEKIVNASYPVKVLDECPVTGRIWILFP